MAMPKFSGVLARTLTPETRTLALSGVISQPEFVLGWRLAVNSFTDDQLLQFYLLARRRQEDNLCPKSWIEELVLAMASTSAPDFHDECR